MELRQGASKWSLGALVVALLALFGVGWYGVVKPSVSNKIADGGTQNNTYNYDVPKVPMLSGGCFRLKADLYWQNDPKSVGAGKEVKK